MSTVRFILIAGLLLAACSQVRAPAISLYEVSGSQAERVNMDGLPSRQRTGTFLFLPLQPDPPTHIYLHIFIVNLHPFKFDFSPLVEYTFCL
jgi:hypothetical protein